MGNKGPSTKQGVWMLYRRRCLIILKLLLVSLQGWWLFRFLVCVWLVVWQGLFRWNTVKYRTLIINNRLKTIMFHSEDK